MANIVDLHLGIGVRRDTSTFAYVKRRSSFIHFT